jgi:predicted permease
VGLPGATLGRKSSSKREPKYILGVVLAIIGHVYLQFSFMIYLITWTKLRITESGFFKYLIWFFCLAAAVGSIQKIHFDANKEAKEHPTGFENPQILSLLITEILAFFAFFLFVFLPESIHPFWSWVGSVKFPLTD